MTVKRIALRTLALRDFRNLVHLDLSFPASGVVVVGDNGQGKTNLLEAIYYLHLLRSVRGARDSDVALFGAPGFHVSAHIASGRHDQVSAGFERQGKRKRIMLDGAEPDRLSDALGALPCVLFSPADVELVAGAPIARRRYLDILLALSSRSYLHALQRYRHALAQRNAALRDAFRAQTAGNEERIAVWDAPLAHHGAIILQERARWTEQASSRFTEVCALIGESAVVALSLNTSVPTTSADLSTLSASLAEGLTQRRALDIRRGVTHTGPHRDDLVMTMGGRELRAFGSAGQQRTAAIALRLLEGETLRERLGVTPVFLLDDPFAELDARRSARILELLGGEQMGQTVLTVPRASDIPPALTQLTRWNIANGVISDDAGREDAA